MKPKFHPSYFRRPSPKLACLPILFSLSFLTACMAPSPFETDANSSPSPSSSADTSRAAATYTPQLTSPKAVSQFKFPMTTCGEQASEPNTIWYAVYIDGGELEKIRSQYCGDALSTTRKSGTPTVQVASLTSYAKALTLAKAVGGVVEQSAQAAAASGSVAQTSPSASATPQPSPAPQPSDVYPVGRSVFLNAGDNARTLINVRQSASTDAPIQSTGYAGERIQIASSTKANDGYTWYEVRLESGSTGWVRGDLVSDTAPVIASTAESTGEDASTDAPSSASIYPAEPQVPYGQSQPPLPYSPAPYFSSPHEADPPYALAPPASPSYDAPYGQQPYGQPPYGQSPAQQPPYGQPPQSNPSGGGYGGSYSRISTLTAREPGAAINVREFASANSRVRYRANPGDPVQVSGSAQGDDGFTWYQVRFSSGAIGWVRGDLLASTN